MTHGVVTRRGASRRARLAMMSQAHNPRGTPRRRPAAPPSYPSYYVHCEGRPETSRMLVGARPSKIRKVLSNISLRSRGRRCALPAAGVSPRRRRGSRSACTHSLRTLRALRCLSVMTWNCRRAAPSLPRTSRAPSRRPMYIPERRQVVSARGRPRGCSGHHHIPACGRSPRPWTSAGLLWDAGPPEF